MCSQSCALCSKDVPVVDACEQCHRKRVILSMLESANFGCGFAGVRQGKEIMGFVQSFAGNISSALSLIEHH